MDKFDWQANLQQLPPLCYTVLNTDKRQVIRIERGQSGYYLQRRMPDAESAQIYADEANRLIGVKPEQSEAMEFGSMFGWDKPGCDPRHYTAEANADRLSRSNVR